MKQKPNKKKTLTYGPLSQKLLYFRPVKTFFQNDLTLFSKTNTVTEYNLCSFNSVNTAISYSVLCVVCGRDPLICAYVFFL